MEYKSYSYIDKIVLYDVTIITVIILLHVDIYLIDSNRKIDRDIKEFMAWHFYISLSNNRIYHSLDFSLALVLR